MFPVAVFLVAVIAVNGAGTLVSARLAVTFAVAITALLIVTSVMILERYEERNNGYHLLLRMPILPSEVAAGKLVVIYLLNVSFCGLTLIAFRLHGFDPEYGQIARSVALLAGCIWLLVVLLMYAGICLLGFTRFVVVFRISVMALLVILQLLLMLLFRMGPDGPVLLADLAERFAGAPWLIICSLTSVVYFACIPITGMLMRRHAAGKT